MKILRLDIEGFRSLKKVSWTPGDLTVVIGPNGSGKSNLLRFLDLVSEAARGGLQRHVRQFGGMGSLVWDGRSESITLDVQAEAVGESPDVERNRLVYQVEMSRVGKGTAFRIEHELLGSSSPVGKDEGEEPIMLLERRGVTGRIFDEHENALAVPEESIVEEETLLSLTASPFTSNRLISAFRKELAAWTMHHDLDVRHDSRIRQAAVARPDMRIAPDGQNLIPVLHTLYTGNRDFKKDIDSAMCAAFGSDYEELVFPPAADQRIQLRVRWKTLRSEQSAADLSDGTLRFLSLLAVLASPDPAPLIAIDEPETGLHPSMFPIVAEFAVGAADRAQVILTTHSPQFLDAFGETRPSTTVAKWSDGESIFKTLDGNALEYWLKEYSMGSLFQSGELENME